MTIPANAVWRRSRIDLDRNAQSAYEMVRYVAVPPSGAILIRCRDVPASIPAVFLSFLRNAGPSPTHSRHRCLLTHDAADDVLDVAFWRCTVRTGSEDRQPTDRRWRGYPDLVLRFRRGA